jgi:hypothetical protein
MEKQLLVSIGRSKFTFSLELEDSAVALPSGGFTIPSRIGNHIRISNVTAKDRLQVRFLRPGIFSAAGFVTVLGLWRMFH